MSESQSTYKRRKLGDQSVLGKLPPQATDLEEAVLGAVLLEREAFGFVADTLKPDHFYKESHKEIYQAVSDLYQEAKPVDILTVTQKLRETGKIETVGGPFYITQLTNKVSSAANIEYHARIILQQAIKRNIIRISAEAQSSAFEDSTDVFELLDSIEQNFFTLSNEGVKKSVRVSKDILSETLETISNRTKQEGEVTGLATGFPNLDRVTSGWQSPDLIIVAARPGMGKTAFVISTIRAASIQSQVPTLLFSLEMSDTQVMERMISAEAKVNAWGIKTGKLEDFEVKGLVHNTSSLANAPIFIDDTPGLSVLEMRAKARRMKAKHNIGLIVVDYLQLMSGGSQSKYSGSNREQEISAISRALKHIAKELNVPVIALSQLSRAVETRGGDKKPQLSDLRESGSIEQDADLVSFLWRPGYYGITQDIDGTPLMDGYTLLMIKKHRNGSLEDVPLQFIGKYTEFLSINQ